MPLARLRQLVTLVPQEPWLHTGTILENIRYGKPGASRAEVMTAARRAGVSTFAERLPDGYHFEVGEHGCSFPAASDAGSRWLVRCCVTRRCCCSMSRQRALTRLRKRI
jgi:ABC-type protease/lipase transport system fused ATPase/permease subunit